MSASVYKSSPLGRKTGDALSLCRYGWPVAAQGTVGDYAARWIAGSCPPCRHPNRLGDAQIAVNERFGLLSTTADLKHLSA
jgi:hypothetical protein